MAEITSDERLRDAFVGWQCRIREYAIRKAEGRPSAGMCPLPILEDGPSLETITTVLNKREPDDSTVEFRFLVKKTHDPRLRFEAAVNKLQVSFYQKPKSFSDNLTALFSEESVIAKTLLNAKACTLRFAQSNQRFDIPVGVIQLDEQDPFYQATFWHNAMFNPNLSLSSCILQFVPDWPNASADPTPFA